MYERGVLGINHRELILSSSRKMRFYFMRLPHDLQDQIINGMDQNSLTLNQASQLACERGFQLSHEAISDYYAAVRERRSQLLAVNAKDQVRRPIKEG